MGEDDQPVPGGCNCDRCFQLMETDEPSLFEQWIANWSDLVEFEVVPVISSAQAAARSAD